MAERTCIHPVDPETARYIRTPKLHGVFALGKEDGKMFLFIHNQRGLNMALEDSRLLTDKKEHQYVTGVGIDMETSTRITYRCFDNTHVGVWRTVTDPKTLQLIETILTRDVR